MYPRAGIRNVEDIAVGFRLKCGSLFNEIAERADLTNKSTFLVGPI
jgi:hypothetical protein